MASKRTQRLKVNSTKAFKAGDKIAITGDDGYVWVRVFNVVDDDTLIISKVN